MTPAVRTNDVTRAERWSHTWHPSMHGVATTLCELHGVLLIDCCICFKYAGECDYGGCLDRATTVSAQGRRVCEWCRSALASMGQ